MLLGLRVVLFFIFPHQNPIRTPVLPHTWYLPRPSHLPWFDCPNAIFLEVWNVKAFAWFQASAAKWVRTALFWVITQRVVAISYRRFGTTYRSHLQRSRIQNPQERSSHEASRYALSPAFPYCSLFDSSTLFSNTVTCVPFLDVSYHVLRPNKITGKLIILHILIFVFLDNETGRP
jgi:hypothetical protein